ncbi:hypothetical protein ACFLRY_00850 [Bacteroidota bacterium]
MEKLRESLLSVLSHKIFKYSSILIALIVLFCSIRYGKYNGNYINSDGKGYYAYLTAIFIYNDLDYNFIDEYESKYYLPESYVDFRSDIGDDVANITFVGTAVMWFPFFIVAHISSYVLGLPTDGYAPLYQYAVGIAAVFYLFLALWGIKKLLEIYKSKPFHIALVQTLIVFATPLYFYTIVDASFTHVYSFAAFTLFLLFTKLYIQKYTPKYLYLAFFFFGLIVLIRPSNMIVAASLPFLAGSWNKLKELFIHVFTHYTQLIKGFIILLLVVSLQPLMYYLQVGKPFVWTYTGVGFNFMDPYFYSILFSYKKGLFIYTPVLLFSLLGFVYLFRTKKFKAWSLLLFLIFMNYILSAWWNWWYGMSYGNRAYIDYFVFFALLFGFALKENRYTFVKYIIYIITPVVIILNLIQTYQYRNFILYWDMDQEMYWRVFLKTDKEYFGLLWRENSKEIYDEAKVDLYQKLDSSTLISELTNNLDSTLSMKEEFIETANVHSGSQAVLLTKKNPYSPGFVFSADNVFPNDTNLFKLSAFVFIEENVNRNYFSLVLSVEKDGKVYDYKAIDSEGMDIKVGEWTEIDYIAELHRPKSSKDVVKVYVWYRGRKEILVDDITLRIYE